MDPIQALSRRTYTPVPAAQKKQTTAAARPSKDTYDYSLSSKTIFCHPTKLLTLNKIRDLGSRYDSTNLTRNQFNALIKELRDCNSITQKAFSDVYTGASPQGSDLTPMPAGEETADWIPLLDRRAQDCAAAPGPNGESLAESYDQVKKAIHYLGVCYDRYPESSDEIAARVVKQNYRSPEELGIPDLTGMTGSQKLGLLRELHRQTNYKGMNDVERYKLISDRFETVFPNRMLYTTYNFMRQRENDTTPWDGSRGGRGLQDNIRSEFERQLVDVGLDGHHGGVSGLHRLAYYNDPRSKDYSVDKDGHCRPHGGGGLSDETRRAVICLRHNSGRTAADQLAILQELRMNTQSYNANGFCTFGIIRSDLIDRVGPDTSPLWDSLDELITDSLECDEVLDKILVGKLGERAIQAEPMYPAGKNAGWIEQYMANRSEISSEDLFLMLGKNLEEELKDDPEWFLRGSYQTPTRFVKNAQADLGAMLEKLLQEELQKAEDKLEEALD